MDRERNHRQAARLSWVVLLLVVVLAVLSIARPAFAAPSFPPLAGRVTDAAGILTAADIAALDAQLATLETTTGTQLVVATVPSLDGYEIDEYGYQLGRAWGIGQKDTDNGAILLVAPNERKVRVEVGYGLEGVLTDALTSQIIRSTIIPRFKAGDMPGGVAQGAAALVEYLQLPPEQARAAALAAEANRQQASSGGDGLRVAVWIIIIVIWIFFSIARRGRGRHHGSSIIWGPGIGGDWGGGGGGGWGGGGGGFGGGGGSFGGGGSSGSW